MNMEGIMKYVILAAILMTMTISVSSYADADIRPDLPLNVEGPPPEGFQMGFPGPQGELGDYGRNHRRHGKFENRRGFRGQKGMKRGRRGPRGMRGHLFPPELVMRQQKELGLSDDQQKKIIKIMSTFQGEVVQLNWNLKSEEQKLDELVSKDKVDAKAADSQIQRILSAEGKLKAKHLGMLIEVKNILNGEQIEKLRDLKQEQRRMRRGGPMGPGGPGDHEGPPPGEDHDDGDED